MWPAGSRTLRRAADLLGRLSSRGTDGRTVYANARKGQPEPLPQAADSAAKQTPLSSGRPDASVIIEHARELRRLAELKQLPELLKDDARRRKFGIPLSELERLFKDPSNHGLGGLDAVKSLRYTDSMASNGGSSGPKGTAQPAAMQAPKSAARRQWPPTPAPLPASAGKSQNNISAPVPSGSQKQPPKAPYNTNTNNGGSGTRPPSNRYTPGGPQQSSAPQQQRPGPGTFRSPPPQSPQPEAVGSTASSSAAAEDTGSATRSSIRDALNQQKIFLPSYAPGTYRLKCPKCKGGSDGEQSFSVKIEEQSKSAMWNCFRSTCGYSGSSHADKPAMVNEAGFFVSTTSRKKKEDPPVRPSVNLEPLTEEMLEFFAARGISKDTLSRNGVASQLVYDPGAKKEARVIAFPYYRDGTLINVKYRTMDKRFWQVRGAEKILYGLDDVVGASEIIIVEGEMDKLALEESGFKNVVSVPDGAPARVRDGALPPASEDTKYSYLWNCRAWLDHAVRVVIATDNDAPGDALAEELARRLGRERCWRVRWPLTQHDHEYAASAARVELPPSLRDLTEESSSDSSAEGIVNTAATNVTEMLPATALGDGAGAAAGDDIEAGEAGGKSSTTAVDPQWYRKDANEVLLRDGAALLRGFVETAEPLPIRGLLRFHEYYDDIIKYYFLELRDAQAVSTGWRALDQFYKVIPGELTIVTGVPNSGKSEWIDALLCNLSELHGWTFALCSMEKRATDHARQLAEKYVGRPFFDLAYSKGMQRMSYEELDGALDWVDDRFHLIRYEDEQLPSIDWVLEIAKAAVYRYGIRGLVIDPYNELDHQRPASMSETEYVSMMLTKVKRFAQTAGVHVWFVAHPRQLREWKGQAPNLYDISGSAHFINKADNGIVVHRSRDPNSPSAAQVEVLVRKVRNKAAGTIGDCVLEYDRINGRYLDGEDSMPPRTSKKMQWALQKQQQGQGSDGAPFQKQQWDQAPGTKLWNHPDGTISTDPPEYG